MKKLISLSICFLMVATALFVTSSKVTSLQDPYSPYGEVYLDGSLITDGAVSAWIDGVRYSLYTSIDALGHYTMDVESDDSVTDYVKEGGLDGEIIIFQLDRNGLSYIADEVGFFQSGGFDQINLNFWSDQQLPFLKINELATDIDGLGSQYVYIYNPESVNVDLSQFYLEKNDGILVGGLRYDLSGIVNSQDTYYFPLSGGFLYSADELKLAWSNPGTNPIAGSGDVILDRVEYGNQSFVPDNTTMPDAVALMPYQYIRRQPQNGSDTNDCSVDFAVYDENEAPYVEVIQPNGGEFLEMGTFYDILWEAQDTDGDQQLPPNPINISYSINGLGGPWMDIVRDYPNMGVYPWQVPFTPSSRCRVMITCFDDTDSRRMLSLTRASQQGYDVSDANFTIGFNISIQAGWNLLSIPLVQDDTAINEVLWDIQGKYDQIQWYNASDTSDPWKTWDSNKPSHMNDLSGIDHKMGFWINITDADDGILSVNGTNATPTTIHLYAGWNHVGYPTLNTTTTVGDAMSGLGVTYKVKGYSSSSPDRLQELSDSYVMLPGEGYWIWVSSGVDWIVDWW